MPLVLPLDWQHLLWSGGKLDNGKLPATGFGYVATSGEVKNGQGVTFPWSALKFGGLEYHMDCFNALQSKLHDSGRPFNMLIPHPDKNIFQAFTAYNSYACISVRSMILMHKGHGGAFGNTVWHGAMFPKREDDSLAFFDEDKLGFLDVHLEFKDYKVE